MTDDALAALEQLFVAGVAVTARALARGGGQDLTFPQWRVLVVLGETADGATVSEVAARIGVTLPATSRQLRRLAHKGLIAIDRDLDDRRATRARMMPFGEAVRQSIIDFRLAEMSKAIGNISLSDDFVARTKLVAQSFASYV